MATVNTGDLDELRDRVNDRVSALVADDPANHLPPVDGGWRRVFGRLQVDETSWALLAYEQDGGPAWSARMVEVFDHGAGGPDSIPHPAGDLVITPIADDPRLPGLRRIADDQVNGGTVRLLRYRPQRRCTLRVTGSTGDHIAKVLADDRGRQFHEDATELWSAARRGELAFEVAEPIRWDAATRSVWQGIVPGAPVASRLLGEGGAEVAGRMGTALASLATSGVRPSITITSDDQLRRTQRAVGNAIRRVPELSDDLGEILDIFAARHAALSPDQLVPVHGAPHMHQWLIDDDQRLGLIDFDRFALGEIELDIATLLAELDYEDDLTQPPSAIEAAVIDGFVANGLQVDRSRLQLYRAHKRMSKVTREAWALRTNGEKRARRHLPQIRKDLES